MVVEPAKTPKHTANKRERRMLREFKRINVGQQINVWLAINRHFAHDPGLSGSGVKTCNGLLTTVIEQILLDVDFSLPTKD
jgi:hypothetical protein